MNQPANSNSKEETSEASKDLVWKNGALVSKDLDVNKLNDIILHNIKNSYKKAESKFSLDHASYDKH